MKRTKITIATLLLAGCVKAEEGIDSTIIRGNLIVPPAEVEEPSDSGETANDSWESATELPMLTYREMSIAGTAHEFGSIDDGVAGNEDYYTLNSKDDGMLEVNLAFETQPGFGRDQTIVELSLFDLDNAEQDCTTDYACAAVEAECGCDATYDEGSEACVEEKGCADECTWEIEATETCAAIATATASSDGTLGDVDLSIEVLGDGLYGILVTATDSSEYDSAMPYTLTVGSLAPVDGTFVVGAYGNQDINAKGNPLGGGSVYDVQWDAAEHAWVGKFEIVHIKSVVTEEINCVTEIETSCSASDCACTASYDEEAGECVADGECEEECTWEVGETEEEVCEEDHTVTEGADMVWLLGGSMSTLNSAVLSGTLYSSTAVQVALGDGEEPLGGWGDTSEPEVEVDTSDTAPPDPVPVSLGEIVVTIDSLQPRVPGWEYAEEEPNDVALIDPNADYNLDMSTIDLANLLPDASGLPFTDVVRGDSSLDVDQPLWAPEYNDVFEFTMVEGLNATITLSWDDCADDLDLHLYDDQGTLQATSWYSCPEAIDTAGAGIPLTGGSTWYIGVLPYTGSIGEHSWSMDIEYAPL